MGRACGSAREEVTRSEGVNQKEKCISVRVPMAPELERPVREVAACEEEWDSAGELSWLGRIPRED
jgi:hypothetical protein